MKTIFYFVLIYLSTFNCATGQVSTLGNSSIFSTDYLGWDFTTTHDLNIRHFRSDQSILFYTNNTERMRIHRDGQLSLGTSSIIGNAKLTVLQKDGIKGISGLSENLSSPIFSPNFYSRVTSGNSNNTSAINFGITATSSSSAELWNYGVEGYAHQGLQFNYGIYAYAPISSTNWAGFFDGGVIYWGTFTWSDESLKTNIQPISDARLKLLTLSPKRYFFNQDTGLNLPENEQFGFLAQEIEEVIPQAVRMAHFPGAVGENGLADANVPVDFKAMNYTQIIPILIQGSQDHDVLISTNNASLQEALERLEVLESVHMNNVLPSQEGNESQKN